MHIQSKLPQIGTTIFTTMSSLATEYNAVNLGQGFPDFEMNKELIDLVHAAMLQGNNQYVHSNGLALLRDRIAEKYANLYQSNIDADKQITITPGGTYAIYTALTTVLNAGDEVIIFEPAYDSYIPNIVVNGAKPICISLQYPNYAIPWNEVRAKVNSKTKMIIINSPHNPTGAVLSQEDINELRSIVANTNIFILSDEVYEHLIFDDLKNLSILRYQDLLERSFVCFSFGKTYHCTGWKMGYCISSAALMQEFRKVHQFNCFSSNSPLQFALASYLNNQDAYNLLGKQFQQKRDFFRNLMQQTPFKFIPSQGSYFECYSYEGLSNLSDKDFAIQLTKKLGVTVIPVSAFYHNEEDNKVIRFCFAKQEATLQLAANRLMQFENLF
ncbi:MAG TPA: methionine aminotransferase [Chitinophagaceae bacterium]|nr:aminotransferase class I/II-fold pyridoxal phosphate-dependent enzyme [Chitinophagaceae bacterium]HNL82293.1 methionine aminotransferase [Chitinophagaceae bacterium]HNM34244.1 methionine aminotransferase [Chitinophagaceae bacterium]HNN31724.1 methionine aminotransferase [Chitinophagaceae bacterium]